MLAAGTFTLVASLLPVAVAIFNLWVLGRPTSRPFAIHPPPAEKFQQLFFANCQDDAIVSYVKRLLA